MNLYDCNALTLGARGCISSLATRAHCTKTKNKMQRPQQLSRADPSHPLHRLVHVSVATRMQILSLGCALCCTTAPTAPLVPAPAARTGDELFQIVAALHRQRSGGNSCFSISVTAASMTLTNVAPSPARAPPSSSPACLCRFLQLSPARSCGQLKVSPKFGE